MPRKRKTQARKKKTTKTRPPKGYMTVSDAAEYLNMTPSGVLAAVKRGQGLSVPPYPWSLTCKRIDGRVFIPRDQVRAYHKTRMDFYFPKPKTQKQLDDEFLQRMWDNDPD